LIHFGRLALIIGLAFPGAAQVVNLSVDAAEPARRVFHARLTMPVKSGPLTLLYPQWIPGDHRPSGPIADMVGLQITGAGRPIVWTRDLVNMFAFHLDVPSDVSEIEVAFDYLNSPNPSDRTSQASATSNLVILNWYDVLLYPQGTPTDRLQYRANLKLPQGWKYGTALPVERDSDGHIQFQTTSLTTLADSPLIAGRYFQTVDLSPQATPPHYLHLAGESLHSIEIPQETIAHYRNLVKETGALFGARHYRSYHFLLALSDFVATGGTEHHESSDDRERELYLTDDAWFNMSIDLLPHEMVHSWNGKYRRPLGLSTPDYNQPMKGDLLWIYEGLTDYLGKILTPRSGLMTPEEFRDWVACVAARLDNQAGRQWRPVEDTAVSVQILDDARGDYADYRRDEEYYPESGLIWLEADVIIRQLSHGTKSLDDFCKNFYGPPNGPPELKPYVLDDVVAALNAVQPYNWQAFFKDRVYTVTAHAPLRGFTDGGWKLIYNETVPDYYLRREDKRKVFDFRYSLGFVLRENDGKIFDVMLGSPAAEAGVPPSSNLIAVNGREFDPKRLRRALADAKQSTDPIELLIRQGEMYKTYRVDYHGGDRYPHLVRNDASPDVLSDILRPHAN
jgi:predicted metalloprotease with PDZ domain